MASAMRKMAVYLGLVEDDRRYQDAYEEYDEYDEPEDAVEPVPARADYGGYASDHASILFRVSILFRRSRLSSLGSRHCIRAPTMRLVLSVSTSVRALR